MSDGSADDELQRLRAEVDRLERDNALLLAAIEASPAGILIATAPDGTIRVANSASLGIRGDSREQLTEIPVELHPARWQTFHADGRPYAPEDLPLSRALLRGEVVDGGDVIIRNAQGEDRWVSGHAAPVYQDGELIAGVVVFPDITDRKRAEAELERFRAMAELTSDFIGMADRQNRVLYLNPAGLRLMGLPEDVDPRGLEIADFYTPAGLELIERGLRSAEERVTWAGETRLRLHDGAEIPVSQVITAHRGASGEIEFYSTIMRDLRPIRSLEAQLLHSQKLEAVGRLAGGVAHDFNNLLTVIVGATDLAEHLIADPQARELLGAIQDASARASRLTSQLLAFARRQIIEPKLVEPTRLFAELEGLLRRLLGKTVELDYRIADSLHPIHIDIGQFEQILVNLAVNGKEAMPQGGTLTITAQNQTVDGEHPSHGLPPGEYVQIRVEDGGVGMSPELRERIFEPFFTTKGQGSGLGLATVHGVVEQNRGHIRVASEVGVGTRFDIWLPRSARESSPTRVLHVHERAAAGSARILLIEDDEAVRELAAQILEAAGHHVTAVATGEAGLEVARAEPPDILVTDVVLPGIPGSEVANILRNLRPLEILFTSGYAEDIIARHGVIQGDVQFLAKPYTPERLRQAVDAALARRPLPA